MRLTELYALTVVGLRRWPNPKTGKPEHSNQRLVVTKDPIKDLVKQKRPSKGKKLFRDRWNPVADAVMAAESMEVQDASGGDRVIRYHPDQIDAQDVVDFVVMAAVDSALSDVLQRERKHNKIFTDEEDPKFHHDVDNYEESAEGFINTVRDKLIDVTSRKLRAEIERAYPELHDVKLRKTRENRLKELK